MIVGAEVRRPRPRGRGCDRREVFLYDVTVNATKSFTEEWVPRFELQGAFSISYAYQVVYRRVAAVVQHECGTGEIEVRARGRGAGKLSNYKWADSVRNANRTRAVPQRRVTSSPRWTPSEPRSRSRTRRSSRAAAGRSCPWRAA